MSSRRLVLSLFPGIGILDRGFEEEGFTVVRGPDLLWGGDIKRFHPPAGVFDGVIGGPPCKGESKLAALNGTSHSLADEFLRIVEEAAPRWWIMEAVKKHNAPTVLKLNNRWFGQEQNRKRYFHSNLVGFGRYIEMEPLERAIYKYAVLAGHGGGVGSVCRRMAKYSLSEACRLQGLPETFHETLPFRRDMKYEVIGNAVPLPMARAVARAVLRALTAEPGAAHD